MTNAALTVQSSLESVQASGVARELAQKKLEAAQSKFEVGMATNYEVVQAQRDFADAQNVELRCHPHVPEGARELRRGADGVDVEGRRVGGQLGRRHGHDWDRHDRDGHDGNRHRRNGWHWRHGWNRRHGRARRPVSNMKKLILIVIVLVAVGAGLGAYYIRRGGADPQVTTLQLTRGDVIDQVGATGTLQATITVQVGTQVSGIVDELYADFNSIVKKGQVIARLDPSILQTQMETARANLVNAQANLERQKAAVEDATTKLTRARELANRSLLPKADLDAADATAKPAQAQLKSMESQIVQAKAAVNKAQVDIDHTVITAPIDGIVISRNVDKGQTVASSMQAPTLFVIAADLTKMQVNANIDESDVGRMRPGQLVHFRVDAYPTEQFAGTVAQVRLNPTTVQNVVTYSTVIDVPNPDLKLKPGMTANVNIEVARRQNVLRVPNAALRFRPTRDTFQALNQAVTPDIERAISGGGFGRGRGGQNAQGGAGTGAPGAQAANGSPSLKRISGRRTRRVGPRGRRQPVGWLPAPFDSLRAR